MSLATASCDLWQNEQRRISSVPVRFFTRLYSFFTFHPPGSLPAPFTRFAVRTEAHAAETSRRMIGEVPIIPSSRLINDIVDDSVFLSLLRVHNEVALHILFHFFQLLPAVLGQQLVGNLAHTQDFTGMNVNIGGLTRQSAHRGLVDEDARIGQGQTFLVFPG